MDRPTLERNALWWAEFLEKPESHLGPADKGLIARILRLLVESQDHEGS